MECFPGIENQISFLKLTPIKYSQRYLLEDDIKTFARKLLLVLKTCNSLVLDPTSVSSTDCTGSEGRPCCGKQQPGKSQLNKEQPAMAEGVSMHRESMTERSTGLVLLLCIIEEWEARVHFVAKNCKKMH